MNEAEILWNAAASMREEWSAHDPADEFCECKDSDSWFDRSICPEPCSSMHFICNECSRIQGYCEVSVDARKRGNRFAVAWFAVADWLDMQAGCVANYDPNAESPWVKPHTQMALSVARTYLGEAA